MCNPKHVIKSLCSYNSEETIMVLDSFSRLKHVQLSRLKCKLIAVKINGRRILMKMFSFHKIYDFAMWSSLFSAFSTFYTYLLIEEVHTRFSVHNYEESDATNYMKNK